MQLAFERTFDKKIVEKLCSLHSNIRTGLHTQQKRRIAFGNWTRKACGRFSVSKAELIDRVAQQSTSTKWHGSEVQAVLVIRSDWGAPKLTVVNTCLRGTTDEFIYGLRPRPSAQTD